MPTGSTTGKRRISSPLGRTNDPGANEAQPRKRSLETATGRSFATPSDENVAKLAQIAGEGGHHDVNVAGENAKFAPGLEMIAVGAESHIGLVAYDLAGKIGAVLERSAYLKANARPLEELLLARFDCHERARRKKMKLDARIEREHVAIHDRTWSYYVAMLGLAIGDLVMLSVCMMVLGLSSHLMFGVIPFSSDLDIAAATAVASLLGLGHYAGVSLRHALHPLAVRRGAANSAQRAALPGLDWVSASGTVALVAVAAIVLLGLSSIRATYFRESDTPPLFDAFLAVQAGMFAVATAISYAHASAYDGEYKHATSEDLKANAELTEADETYAKLVAESRTLTHRLRTVVTEAVHHAGLGSSDVRRLLQMYMFVVREHAPEPVTDLMFDPALLTEVRDYTGTELLEALTGPIALPPVEAVDDARVERRREQCRENLDRLRVELESWPQAPVQSDPDDEDTSTDDDR